MEIKRKTIKCQICYGDLLGDVSDTKDPDERLERLMDFCQTLQEICWKEATIKTLKNWRKVFKKGAIKNG